MIVKASEIRWTSGPPWFESEMPVHVPLFGCSMAVWIETDDTIAPPQIEALQQLLDLSPSYRDELTHPIALNCHYVSLAAEIAGWDAPVLNRRADVWSMVRLRTVTVPEHGRSRDRYVFVSGGCDWDEEHGVELLFKNGRLMHVTEQRGLSRNEEWALYYINE